MKCVIGIDEVGRGPLAGPVTVCAAYLLDENAIKKLIFNKTIRDSKMIKKDNRINIFKTIRKNSKLNKQVIYSISSRSAKYIDRNGINNSIKACVGSCLRSLEKKGVDVKNVNIKLDGGLYLDKSFKKQKTYIKGDENHVSIAIASIIAKVSRDKYMEEISKTNSDYLWDKNSGYGTKLHIKIIKEKGITKYHRKSYLRSYLMS